MDAFVLAGWRVVLVWGWMLQALVNSPLPMAKPLQIQRCYAGWRRRWAVRWMRPPPHWPAWGPKTHSTPARPTSRHLFSHKKHTFFSCIYTSWCNIHVQPARITSLLRLNTERYKRISSLSEWTFPDHLHASFKNKIKVLRKTSRIFLHIVDFFNSKLKFQYSFKLFFTIPAEE